MAVTCFICCPIDALRCGASRRDVRATGRARAGSAQRARFGQREERAGRDDPTRTRNPAPQVAP